MLCFQLHKLDNGCRQDLSQGSDWKYCPTCGRSTGHVSVEKKDGQLNVQLQTPTTCSITIGNTGLTSVNVTTKLEALIPGVRLGAAFNDRTLSVGPKIPLKVGIELPALTKSDLHLGALIIRVQDGALESGDDPWKNPSFRQREIVLDLIADIDTPADVHAIEEIAIFREGVEERTITLVNDGKSPARIVNIQPPTGYEATLIGDSNRLGYNQSANVAIRRLPNVVAEPESMLLVRIENGVSCAVELHSASSASYGSLDQAVIGIDFGTTFSSVSFRKCLHDPEVADQVVFLTPPGEDDNTLETSLSVPRDPRRFPSRLWIGRSGELAFGTQANIRYSQDPGKGFLLREVKTLLRDSSLVQLDPLQFRAQGIEFVKRRFGSEWGEMLVTEYLRWLYKVCIQPAIKQYLGEGNRDVRFVFSIPALDWKRDGQPQYERQRAAMERCILRAGFPLNADRVKNRVEIEFEPVCAAIGLLHPPHDVDTDTTGEGGSTNRWPVLGSNGYRVDEDDAIAVFDSGGGTTDVVLARVRREPEDGKLFLPVEKCLGVGSEAETFGGEWVTDQVWKSVRNPGLVTGVGVVDRAMLEADRSITPATDWYQGVADFAGLYESEYDPNQQIERPKAEKLKYDLADELDVEMPASVGAAVITPTLLTHVTFNKLQSLSQELDERVFDADQRDAVRYYLFVGGNTRLPFVRKWAERFMNDQHADYSNRRLLLPEKYRQLAVAYGAAWVPDARVRNAAPYGLVALVGAQEEILLELPQYQSQDVTPNYKQFPVSTTAPLPIRLQAMIGARKLCVGAARIVNDQPRQRYAEVGASMHNGEMRITYRWSDSMNSQNVNETLLLKYKL